MLWKKDSFSPGLPHVVETESPNGGFGAVFEDDGETGYFYVLDLSANEQIQESFLIYNVRSVTDRAKLSEVAIAWTDDGNHVALFINSHAHAIADFAAKRGFCRSNFPSPSKWPCEDFQWDDQALALFRPL